MVKKRQSYARYALNTHQMTKSRATKVMLCAETLETSATGTDSKQFVSLFTRVPCESCACCSHFLVSFAIVLPNISGDLKPVHCLFLSRSRMRTMIRTGSVGISLFFRRIESRVTHKTETEVSTHSAHQAIVDYQRNVWHHKVESKRNNRGRGNEVQKERERER